MSKATDALRAYMKAERMTQKDFAASVKMSPEHISRLMNGKHTPGIFARAYLAAVTSLDIKDGEYWNG